MNEQPESRRIPILTVAGICGLVLVTGGGITWLTVNNGKTSPPVSSRSVTTPPPPPLPPSSGAIPSPGESPGVVIPVPPPNSGIIISPSPQSSSQTQTSIPRSSQGINSPLPTPLSEKSGSPVSQSVSPGSQESVEVYWLKENSGKLEVFPTKVTIATALLPEVTLQEAFNHLLKGPRDRNDIANEIPKGTKIRKMTVKGDSVYIDLSKEFTNGGGSNSMIGRLGQVIYTATSLKPDGKVWISVEGKPLQMLGGEGLEVPQPSTRANFQKNFLQ
jgi:spore germination protein GerM